MTWAIAFLISMVLIAAVVHLVLKRSEEQDRVFEEIDRREEKWHKHVTEHQKILECTGEMKDTVLKEIILADLDRDPIKPRLAWAIIEYARMHHELPCDDQQMINNAPFDKIHIFGRSFNIVQLEILRSTYLRRCARSGELLLTGEPAKYDSTRKGQRHANNNRRAV